MFSLPGVRLEGNLEQAKWFLCGHMVQFWIEQGCSLREAVCTICDGSKRNRDLARAIVKTYLGNDVLFLGEGISYMEHCSIYEAQASGPIHECLKKLPHYHCSEYFDNVPLGSVVESGIKCENLERLTYTDNSFIWS